jgi:hypothetical protein
MVMARFPKTKKEYECRTERVFREAARKSYYEKLLLRRMDGEKKLSVENADTTVGISREKTDQGDTGQD